MLRRIGIVVLLGLWAAPVWGQRSETATSTGVPPQHVIVDSMPAGASGLTDTELRATPVDVSVIGNVTFSNTTLAVTNAGVFGVQAAQSGAWSVNTKTALTVNSPTAATVGVASAQALASNASRKGLIAVNTSNATISCAIGSAAVLNSGITLAPGAAFTMNEYTFGTGAMNCIAGAAASNLSLQEFQ
jgi:hypothetical protein